MRKRIKWWGTALCLIGILLTSANVFPANIFFGAVGSALWVVAGYWDEDAPLVLVEAAAVLMYVGGILAWVIR